ncbi:MAG: hypothetical protein CME70_23565 [Halobacteriovorax sp.]|nr:hypothetical protein [Halobacteriovorax sp.]
MSKSIVKEKPKSLKKTKNPSPTEFKEPFVPVVRKELSSFGKFFILGMWGLLAFVAGVKMTVNNSVSPDQLALIEKRLDELNAKKTASEFQSQAVVDARVKYVKDSLEKDYEDRLYKISKAQDNLMIQKDELISSLKNELAYNKLKQIDRGPAAVVPYSYKNADILRFEHKQKLKRLKEYQKKREENFVASSDLRDPTVREAFVSLQEKHELERYAMKRSFQEERSKFRKEKFYVRK